jgi:putative colanic acid biosynthesis acetyltransferase WcaF
MLEQAFISPYSTANRIRRMMWTFCWTLLARPFPKSTCMCWKRFLLRSFGGKIADTANIYATANVFMPWNLEMRAHSCLASGVDCYNAAPVIIGVHATVSQRCYLCTASHNISSSRHEQTESPILIEDKAWIAAEAFIGPGVTIGEGAIVGARAAVFKDVTAWTVVGGNPARFLKNRTINH